MITWHYHRWTGKRWILHSVSSISARLLLRQEMWKQSLGTLLEGMSESLCHAVKCWALYCVLSVWAWNYTMCFLPLFVRVHAFARYVVICGNTNGYFCICVHLCAHEKHCVGLHVVVCECWTLSHCLPKVSGFTKALQGETTAVCLLLVGTFPEKTSMAESFNEKGKDVLCFSVIFWTFAQNLKMHLR